MAKAVYKTHCDICFCSFNTTNALQRHRVVKHRGARSISFLPFYTAEEVVRLPSNKFKGRREEKWYNAQFKKVLPWRQGDIGSTQEQRGRDALEAAKAKAQSHTANQTPTQNIQIVVGYGEGRATREFELIW